MSSLLAEIEPFLARHAMTPTQFGRLAVSDGHFVRQLRSGRRTWPETEAKVRRFMFTYRRTTEAEAA